MRLGAGLLERAEGHASPQLLVAGLEGDAFLLGGHQRAASALRRERVSASGLPVVRRLGGGKTLRVGSGVVGVYLALPRADALLDAPIAADRVINRYVRGLNLGLTQLGGRPVHYFGRDFISAQSHAVGWVSQEGSGSGAVLFEAFVSAEANCTQPAEFSAYLEHGDPRAAGQPPAWIFAEGGSPDIEEIARAIASGYAKVHGAEVERGDGAPREAAPEVLPVWEDEAGWEDSGVADIAIGFFEALLRSEGGRVGQVRFRGDFIAPAFAIRELEEALVGTELRFEALGPVVDAAFRRPGAAILGVRSLRIFADAVLAAGNLLEG